jgi:tetratricopeptide (TPR) repeat protein
MNGADHIEAADFPASEDGRFFRRTDWAAFGMVLAAALGVYTWTLAPTVSLEDSGELIVAAQYLGVPHPPGYPIWTLGSWFFQWIFSFMTFHGHPNPAWGVNFFSAVTGAGACALLALLVSRAGADLLRRIPRLDKTLGEHTETVFCWTGGVAAGLLFAFSPVLWSQSVIAEVYSLNTLFQMLVLVLLYRWMARPKEPVPLYLMAFVFSLGLTNHHTLFFLVLALAVAVLVRAPRLFLDFMVAGMLLGVAVAANLLFGHLKMADWTWLEGPQAPGFWLTTLWFLAVPFIAMRTLPHGRTVGVTLLLAWLGLAFYLYMPIASEQNPPMNWAYPRTWEGFLHSVGRQQYEQVTPGNIFSRRFVDQCFNYLTDLRRQFSLPVLLVGFLPFTAWEFSLGAARRKTRMSGPALTMIGAALLLVTAEFLLAGAGRAVPIGLIAAYKACAGMVILLALVGMGLLAMDAFDGLSRLVREGSRYSTSVAGLLFALIAVALGYALFMIFRAIGASPTLPPFGKTLAVLLVTGTLGALAGVSKLRTAATQLRMETDSGTSSWLLTTWIGFLAMSFIFIAVLNPELDLQTVFIQRVQFIPSHAFFAIWIGLGIVTALAIAERELRGSAVARWSLAAIALAGVPGTPLWKNAADPYILRAFGSAEQRGHHYGWYFGNWSLRGVEGIVEDLRHELDPDMFERVWASYPDPAYPPPVSQDAIFFGGTDPGRFVPTYMIYSARTRPDVYLVTQNALADPTYLNVMRDLYGDDIFIPSVHDSNMAFQDYYTGVAEGRIHAGADVSSRDGRVVVEGVGGVMQINTTLSRVMFEKNRHAHEFYVEESYAIEWMNDYLTPHGLILKLNRQKTPLTDDHVRRDREFWAWVTDRMMSDPRFLRDISARKSFSKLRTSIAGLYAARGRPEEAEAAFLQSIRLYPMSPEAVFRLADMYVQRRRFDDALALLEAFRREDPRNTRVDEFVAYISRYTDALARRIRLERELAAGRLSGPDALELARLHRDFGQAAAFERLARHLVASESSLDTEELRRLGMLCVQMNQMELVERILRIALTREPDEASYWYELAVVRVELDRPEAAVEALREAIRLGGAEVREAIYQTPLFDPLHRRPDFQALFRSAAPAPAPLPSHLRDLVP